MKGLGGVNLNQYGDLSVFRQHMLLNGHKRGGAGVTSRLCFERWKEMYGVGKPGEFVKKLFGHLEGKDGHVPFTEKEESLILKHVREVTVWPCFFGWKPEDIPVTVFSRRGFHEARRESSSISKINPVKRLESKSRYLSSFEVFTHYAALHDIHNTSSMVLSKECFTMWVKSRRNGVKKPEHSFRKALIAHLSGKDGRRPFPPDIEADILKQIRKKGTWPCFLGRSESQVLNIGKKGFKHAGYHESRCASEPSASKFIPIKRRLTQPILGHISQSETHMESDAYLYVPNHMLTTMPMFNPNEGFSQYFAQPMRNPYQVANTERDAINMFNLIKRSRHPDRHPY